MGVKSTAPAIPSLFPLPASFSFEVPQVIVSSFSFQFAVSFTRQKLEFKAMPGSEGCQSLMEKNNNQESQEEVGNLLQTYAKFRPLSLRCKQPYLIAASSFAGFDLTSFISSKITGNVPCWNEKGPYSEQTEFCCHSLL